MPPSVRSNSARTRIASETKRIGPPEQGSAVRPARRSAVLRTVTCEGAGAKVQVPGWYVVKPGNSLWSIAALHYANGTRYKVIQRADRKLARGTTIHPCQKVFLPA